MAINLRLPNKFPEPKVAKIIPFIYYNKREKICAGVRELIRAVTALEDVSAELNKYAWKYDGNERMSSVELLDEMSIKLMRLAQKVEKQ